MPINKKNDIAIIGMSGIFPKSNDLSMLWENLLNGIDMASEIPKNRWDWTKIYGDGPGKTRVKWGAFIDDVDKFDAKFFNISPREAESMDPQQRILMEVMYKALEHAGYSAKSLAKSKTGVFVGASTRDYIDYIEPSVFYTVGNCHSIYANRFSYLLNLLGPSMAIDTACSSSLIALHEAIGAILMGDCNLAIVSGVNMVIGPSLHISMSKADMLSLDGHLKAFDKSANGYVRGEGVGAIVIKPLEQALNDGDTVYGIIKGSAINHGGLVKSITVPNPDAQADVIMSACEHAEIDVEEISYIEAHATGTRIGDWMEINGLKKAFATLQAKKNSQNKKENYCGLGSVKTNCGHLEAGAGVLSVLKVLLAFQAKKLPGLANFQELNPKISFENSPFYLVEKNQEWTRLVDSEGKEVPRIAGVSSFGFGGANAHVILQEPDVQTQIQGKPKAAYLITLSAKSENALKRKIEDLYAWVTIHKSEFSLADFAFTLNAGRDHHKDRCSFVVKDISDLLSKLKALKEGVTPVDCLRSTANTMLVNSSYYAELAESIFSDIETQETTPDEYRAKLVALSELYVNQLELDWDKLHAHESKRRIGLPTYPFEKVRYWYEPETDLQETHWKSLLYQMESVPYQASFQSEPLTEQHWLVISNTDNQLTIVDKALRLTHQSIMRVHAIQEENYDKIIYLIEENESEILNSIELHSKNFLHLYKYLSQSGQRPQFNVISSNALSGNTIAGLCKVANLENPAIQFRYLEIQELAPDETKPEIIKKWLLSKMTDYFMSYKTGQFYVPRLHKTKILEAVPPLKFNRENTYLVTGGKGGVGLELVQWLIDNRVKYIILLGRSPLTADMQNMLSIFRGLKANVEYMQVDVSDISALSQCFDMLKQKYPPLKGIFHAAGVLNDKLLQEIQWSDLEKSYAGKIKGAWNLHSLTQEIELDYFVCFSSVAVLGNAGQAGYAAANSFVDALITYRQARNLPGISLTFGPWNAVGMTKSLPQTLYKRWKAVGISPLSALDALRAMAYGMQLQSSFFVLDMDWKVYLQNALANWQRPWFEVTTEAQDTRVVEPKMKTILQESETLLTVKDEVVRLKQLIVLITGYLQEVFKHSVDEQASWSTLGMDSLNSLQLITEVKKWVPSINMTVKDLLVHDSVFKLAENVNKFISSQAGKHDHVELIAETFLLSPQQLDIWHFMQHSKAPETYHVPMLLKVKTVDVAKLENAINTILDIHSIFSVTFVEIDGQVLQHKMKNVRCQIEILEADSQSLDKKLYDNYSRPFELHIAPLFRCLVIKTPETCILQFVFHHLICDGQTIEQFLKAVNDEYNGHFYNKSHLVQYQSYINWIWEKLYFEFDDALFSYWKHYLDGYTYKDLFENVPSIDRTPQGAIVQGTLDKSVVTGLQSLCQKHELSLASLFLAGLYQTIYHFTQSNDVATVVFTSGRENNEFANVFGDTSNDVMLRCKLDNENIVITARAIKNQMELLNEYQHMRLQTLEKLHLNISMISFDFQRHNTEDINLDNQSVEMLSQPHQQVLLWGDNPRHLSFKVYFIQNNIFKISLKYRMDKYTEIQAKTILDFYLQTMLAMIQDKTAATYRPVR